MSATLTLSCPRHPKYQAKRMPKRCYLCFHLWNVVHFFSIDLRKEVR